MQHKSRLVLNHWLLSLLRYCISRIFIMQKEVLTSEKQMQQLVWVTNYAFPSNHQHPIYIIYHAGPWKMYLWNQSLSCQSVTILWLLDIKFTLKELQNIFNYWTITGPDSQSEGTNTYLYRQQNIKTLLVEDSYGLRLSPVNKQL